MYKKGGNGVIKVLIADDDVFIRESLSIILNMDEDIKIERTVENGLQAVEYCRNNKIDIALLDIRMPVMNGVEATKIISKEGYGKVLILTTFDEDDYIREALHFGAKGYILKQHFESIVPALKAVELGQSVFGEEIISKIPTMLNNNDSKKDISKYHLIDRDIEIISLVSQGLSNKEISAKIFLSEGTIRNYISGILEKLNLRDRTQLAIFYFNNIK